MEKLRLVALPTEQTLMHQVHEALDEVSGSQWQDITHDAIASALAIRLKKFPNIFCFAGRRQTIPSGCDGPEHSFDFCAFLYENQMQGFLFKLWSSAKPNGTEEEQTMILKNF